MSVSESAQLAGYSSTWPLPNRYSITSVSLPEYDGFRELEPESPGSRKYISQPIFLFSNAQSAGPSSIFSQTSRNGKCALSTILSRSAFSLEISNAVRLTLRRILILENHLTHANPTRLSCHSDWTRVGPLRVNSGNSNRPAMRKMRRLTGHPAPGADQPHARQNHRRGSAGHHLDADLHEFALAQVGARSVWLAGLYLRCGWQPAQPGRQRRRADLRLSRRLQPALKHRADWRAVAAVRL